MSPYDDVDALTDEPLTPMLRVRVLDYAAGLSRDERAAFSTAIDNTCIYTQGGTMLMDAQACQLHEWHTLANVIRTQGVECPQ